MEQHLQHPFDPDLSLIDAWSDALQKTQPHPAPYLAAFERSGKQLRYIAARHEGETASPTLRTVRQMFDDFRPQVVVVEGVPNEGVVSPAGYLAHCKRQALDDFRKGGEGSYATVLAGERGIDFIPGEPTDRQIHAGILAQGYATEDILGHHAVIMLHQKKREKAIEEEGTPEKIQKSLDSYSRKIGVEPDFKFEEFCAWYGNRMGKDFSLEGVLAEATSFEEKKEPSFLQKMTQAVDNVREPHIVRVIAEQLSRHDRVLVVYGSSHLAKQERVLEKMLGKPEYRKPF